MIVYSFDPLFNLYALKRPRHTPRANKESSILGYLFNNTTLYKNVFTFKGNMNKIYIIFFMFFFSILSAYKYDLTVCAVFQNESGYLQEWIEHNLSIGVDHFILYNNNSIDDYKEILKPYIKKKIVKLIEWPTRNNDNELQYFCFTVQPEVYTDAIERCRGKSKWLAIIDTDEFIISMKGKSVFDTLEREYRKFSGVCVNWQCYGTSNIFLSKNQSMLKSLVYKLPKDHSKNLYYKSIVQPEHVVRCPNPHFCYYTSGHYQVNAIKEPIGDQNTGVYIDTLRINHYWTRDEWFLHNIKIPRYEKWGTPKEDILNAAQEMNQVLDSLF